MGALLQRDRLAAVLGMLGSAHDGEALAAARMAERMRREAGATWHELLAASEPHTATEAPPWRQLVQSCQARPGRLTAWEVGFVREIAGYTREPSQRQMAILAGIAAKAAA